MRKSEEGIRNGKVECGRGKGEGGKWSAEVGMWNAEKGSGKGEFGMRKAEVGSQNSHRPTQTRMDTNFIKGFTVCVCLCVSVANHIKKCDMAFKER